MCLMCLTRGSTWPTLDDGGSQIPLKRTSSRGDINNNNDHDISNLLCLHNNKLARGRLKGPFSGAGPAGIIKRLGP